MSNPDVNSRMVLAMRNIGVGHAGMQDFCRTFNMKGLAVNTYTNYVKKLKDTCEAVVKRTPNKAAQHVRSVYEVKFPELKDQRIIDVAVTYDGTWHRRGRTSHYGVSVVIDLMTGLAIDFELLSNFCHCCTLAKNTKSQAEFDEWFEEHKNECQANHDGSACSMESKAALILWNRSIDNYGLRYTTVLSDGDAKTK
ncbi:uncharacterized protein LOC117112009 [Anneissia japonica]|uniref:uncharacterized protein LOC117112009 n=1 Tax=Anneissia japonica TaxID=1529436 RepID=UPI00142592DA|nr:uncharacterized protein LOC117112009 [Anneissia japonica]